MHVQLCASRIKVWRWSAIQHCYTVLINISARSASLASLLAATWCTLRQVAPMHEKIYFIFNFISIAHFYEALKPRGNLVTEKVVINHSLENWQRSLHCLRLQKLSNSFCPSLPTELTNPHHANCIFSKYFPKNESFVFRFKGSAYGADVYVFPKFCAKEILSPNTVYAQLLAFTTVTSSFLRHMSSFCNPQLGRSISRGKCWAAIRLSLHPESCDHAIHLEVYGLDSEGKHGQPSVLLRHTSRRRCHTPFV